MSGDQTYEVYALRYARQLERSAQANLLAFDIHDGPMPIDYFVWLIKGHGHTILVDTGFDRIEAQSRQREILIEPAEALGKFGVAPDSIDHVVLTHLHYDHAGTTHHFPNAVFHLQDREMAYATGRNMLHAQQRHAFSIGHVTQVVGHVYKERVRFHDGDAELAPGVSLHLIGGHTAGLQSVRVRTRRGMVVLASDAAHFYANIRRRIPFPIVLDVGDMFEGWRKLEALADSPDHIVPGHDPLVRELYPALPIDGVEVYALHEAPSRAIDAQTLVRKKS
jgi:glyoxylase-like metal-dependent hydrolase (beta-lactamase superfamily II)